jgi:MoaA/NifB/PqqE/SkfB family radical SAM enzyme
MLLTKDRAAELREHVHLLAVSLDGAEDVHNRVRGRADAFRKANAGLEVLAEAGIPFGVAFGVSRHSLPDVPWAFERAREVGATLLHLRPLVALGRAKELSQDWWLSREDLARLAVIAALLESSPGGLPHVQVDLVTTGELADARDQFELLRPDARTLSLSDAVNPLVIDELGHFLPFTYGIHPRFTITDFSHDWVRDIALFSSTRRSVIVDLLNTAFDAAATGDSVHMDWFAHLTSVSYETPKFAATAEPN